MLSKAQILLGDDDPDDHRILKDCFSDLHWEFELITFLNGSEVLTYLRNNELLPDLVILDVNMPKMDGFETLARIKSTPQHAHLPVIIYSTACNEREKRLCRQLGAFLCERKGKSFGESLAFATRVKNILDEKKSKS